MCEQDRDVNRVVILVDISWKYRFIRFIYDLIWNFYRTIQKFTKWYNKSKGDKECLGCREAQNCQGGQKMIVDLVCTTRLGKPVTSIVEQNCSGLLLWPPSLVRSGNSGLLACYWIGWTCKHKQTLYGGQIFNLQLLGFT